MSILYNRAVLLAKVESTFGEDAAPSPSTDAHLVGDPQVSYDITQLERNITRATLSKLPSVTGRKIASAQFTYEVRNNGVMDGSVPPAIGTLLRGCAMAQTSISTPAGTIGDADPQGTPTGEFTFTKTTAYDGAITRVVTIECTTAGASGTAEFKVSAPAVSGLAAYEALNQVMTDATPFPLMGSAVITPTVGTSFVLGDTFTITLRPARVEYTFTSDTDSMESLTLYIYFDGLLHKLTGARGTFTVEGTGGNYANFNFDFTGNYVDVIDSPMPINPNYETQKPTMVELANLNLGGVGTFCASSFSLDAANEVVIRDCINNAEGYAGAMIVARTPTATIDPEAELVATHDFFGIMKSGAEMEFHVAVGTQKGNVVEFYAPNVQYRSIGYGERNSIRIMDVQLGLTTNEADDELVISFS